MISIQLGPEPQVLVEYGKVWGEEYERCIEDGDKVRPERYRRDDIRGALRVETHKKCAYCESIFEHVSYAHIEHILPKFEFPLLVCDWSNLTLACSVCNTNKGAYHDAAAPLLNPYSDEVELEVIFYGPMAINRSDRARLTIAKLKLNRPGLLFKRQQALYDILRIIELIASNIRNPAIKNALVEELHDRLGADAEYSSCANNFLITYRVPWKGTVSQRVRIPPGKLSLQPVAIGADDGGNDIVRSTSVERVA